jgi:hypothetical protein
MLVRKKKNGSLRICLDPRYLNQYLKRAAYPLPDNDEVFARIRGAQFFSVIDLTNGFWQLPLDLVSSKLCTFNTFSPLGRFRFLRLPFGLSPAPEIFHQIVTDTLAGLDGVQSYIDDILVWGTTREEHDRRLRATQSRLTQTGFTINVEKTVLAQRSVRYLGHILSGDGIQLDHSKVQAMVNLPPPTSPDELRSFLGAVTYLSRFIPRFADLTAPLHAAVHAKTPWEWTTTMNHHFQLLKTALTEAPVLAPFDQSLPTTVAADASPFGLGAALLQEGRPVAYAARSLHKAERNYSQIEKELLGVVFGCERFAFYTTGRPTQILTDHEPLVGLVDKQYEQVTPRLTRFLERLWPFQLKFKYVKGIHHQLPDFLSRLPGLCDPPPATDSVAEGCFVNAAHRDDRQLVLDLLGGG